jgi:GT2 family glycosyltransferase
MTLDCMEAAIPGILEIPLTKLIVINDSSPEVGMQDALIGMANRWPNVVQLLANDHNLGFVATVNKGMRLYGDHDIVLLNSDVIVPNGWLKRLRDDAYSRAGVASVTPLSNNTTICTFPEFLQHNSIPFGLNVRAVDEVFAEQRLPCVEAPTGIGFCMYIKRNALADVGYFNEECFGRGYGEENDFCQRAIKRGYVNLISPNLYVYHRGGVSFGVDKEALGENAMRVIDALHPNYHADVQRFIAADPLRSARILRFARLIADAQIPKILHISHGIGGGVDQHIEELSDAVDGRAICILLSPRDDGACVEVRLGIRKTADGLFFNLPQQHDELLILLRYLEVSLIHYHHVLRLDPALLNLPNALSVDHVLTIHDFFLLNGNPTLTDKNGVFPGRYNDQLSNPLYPLPGGMTPKKWRDSYRQLVETAKAVIFPTQSTYKFFGDHYALVRPVVAYHPELSRKVDTPFKGISKKERYTIGVIGAISKEKGADLLEDVAMLAQDKQMTLDFVLIGYAYRPLRRIKATGPYTADKLQQLLIEYQIDVCFFPARCPETYSYTISSALESGLPIIAPNLGAFPERLANRQGVLLFDHLSSADAVLCQMESFIEQNLKGTPPSCPEFAGISASTCFYENEYLTLCTKRHNSGDKGMLNIVVGPALHRRRTVREMILTALWKIYSHRSMRWVDTVVSFTILRAVKRFISRRSIYEIYNR